MNGHPGRGAWALVAAFGLLAACGVADAEPSPRPAPERASVELAPPQLPAGTAPAAVTTDTAIRVEPPLRSITLAFTGDNLTHSPIVRQAERNAGGRGYDFRPIYARVQPLLSSVDLAICHLETPIAPPGEPLSTAPLYGVPAEIADALAFAGYDRCSTASNHTLDRGVAGIETTVGNLERVGISQVGMARWPEEAVAQLVTVKGVQVAHLSYTFSYNGLQPPRGEEWRSNLIDAARVVADALDARRRGPTS